MSKQHKSSSRPPSVASSTRSGTPSNRGRFFRPVPYSTTLALQQLIEGGSSTSYATRPTNSPAASSSNLRRHSYTPSPASTRRDQTDSDVGRGANLPIVDENGQVWMDWEEKQEFTQLMASDDHESGWVGFKQSDGRESDEESAKRPFDAPSRQLLEAFSFQQPTRQRSHETMVGPDQILPRPRGKARIRRVKTSESLRAGSAPIVIPPVPSAHHTHPLSPINRPDESAVKEFIDASFDPANAMTKEEIRRLANAGKRNSISFKGLAKKFIWKK